MGILRHWDDVPTQGVNAVLKRQIEGTGASLVRVEVKAGTRADRHSHTHEQFVQVLSGDGELQTAEGRQRFMTGSVFHFPPDTWHAAIFETDTVLVETNVTPA